MHDYVIITCLFPKTSNFLTDNRFSARYAENNSLPYKSICFTPTPVLLPLPTSAPKLAILFKRHFEFSRRNALLDLIPRNVSYVSENLLIQSRWR